MRPPVINRNERENTRGKTRHYPHDRDKKRQSEEQRSQYMALRKKGDHTPLGRVDVTGLAVLMGWRSVLTV